MRTQITLYYPRCQRSKIKKNGKKLDKKQHYICQSCRRQFTSDHALKFYKGCHSGAIRRILLMLAGEIGIRDISVIEGISTKKV